MPLLGAVPSIWTDTQRLLSVSSVAEEIAKLRRDLKVESEMTDYTLVRLIKLFALYANDAEAQETAEKELEKNLDLHRDRVADLVDEPPRPTGVPYHRGRWASPKNDWNHRRPTGGEFDDPVYVPSPIVRPSSSSNGSSYTSSLVAATTGAFPAPIQRPAASALASMGSSASVSPRKKTCLFPAPIARPHTLSSSWTSTSSSSASSSPATPQNNLVALPSLSSTSSRRPMQPGDVDISQFQGPPAWRKPQPSPSHILDEQVRSLVEARRATMGTNEALLAMFNGEKGVEEEELLSPLVTEDDLPVAW